MNDAMLNDMIESMDETEKNIVINYGRLTPPNRKVVHRLVRILTLMRDIPEKDKADAQYFWEAMKSEGDKLTPEKFRGYVAAMEAALAPPGTSLNDAECALSEISYSFSILEYLLDRFFNEDLTRYRDQLGEISTSLLMDCDATGDMYNHYAEEIREAITKAEEYMTE